MTEELNHNDMVMLINKNTQVTSSFAKYVVR